MKLKFTVTGMTCAACSARVEKVTRAVSGVENAQVNLLGGTMLVEVKNEAVQQDIVRAVTDAGYGASLAGENKPAVQKDNTDLQSMKKRIIYSTIFLGILMYFTMGHMVGLPLPHWYHGQENALIAALLQFLLTLPVVYLNRVYYTRGLKALWHRAPNMDSLIAVGSGAALVYGVAALFRMAFAMGHGQWETVNFYRHNLYFESAAMILTLITLGKFLEGRAKGKTGDAIRALMDLRPETTIVLRDGAEVVILSEQVMVGDVVVVRSGGRIPVDGVVLEGHAAVDQSALTGESIPVEKTVGDNVFAATINTSGFLKFRAQKVGEDTTLQQIIRMVDEAGGTKAPIARTADKIAGIFVPVVMTIAALAFVIWILMGKNLEFALTAAISVLVISCPCALGLATPVAIMVGTGKGASLGVLFKNGAALEHLHNIDTIVLDKTGTLTTGKPVVTDIISNRDDLLIIAAALEKQSEHPFAKAILEKAVGLHLPDVTEFKTLPGMGVSGIIDGDVYFGGNAKLMQERGIAVEDYPQMAQQGKTPLYFASKDKLLGVVFAADALKDDSAQVISSIEQLGVSVIMLTGDNDKTAKAIAHEASIKQVISEVLPTEKAGVIQALQQQGKRVLMVGDGINDAPALALADVGMAIGAGTDIAMESADVVLMNNSLTGVCNAIVLSKATIRNIRQNLFWAFFYNCLGIPVAALGLLSPMIGAAAMSMSSVFVVSNALRLRRFQPKTKPHEKAEEKKSMEMIIKVEGMMCSHCKAMVEKVCKAVAGTVDAVVDLQAKTVTVTGDASLEALKKAIMDAGYEVVE